MEQLVMLSPCTMTGGVDDLAYILLQEENGPCEVVFGGELYPQTFRDLKVAAFELSEKRKVFQIILDCMNEGTDWIERLTHDDLMICKVVTKEDEVWTNC